MNKQITWSVSCLFITGVMLMVFGLQGNGKLSLSAIVEFTEDKRSFSEIFQPVESHALPQINYPDVYFQYDLNDRQTYYSSLIDEGFRELYKLFVDTKSDHEIQQYIRELNTNSQQPYTLNFRYNEQQQRQIILVLAGKRLTRVDVLNLLLTNYSYAQLKSMLAERNMLHKVDERNIQYLTAILSFDAHGHFVDVRRR